MRASIVQLAYRVTEELRVSPHGRTVAQLVQQLGADAGNVGRALTWLRGCKAPIETRKRRRQRLRVLVDQAWRIPFDHLDPQCQIFELERVIAPGADATLISCVLRSQRENQALRARLIRITQRAA